MKKRRDSNHKESVGWFSDLGCSVVDLSQVGGNCPDLLVAKYGISMLIEVKSDKGRLSKGQTEFMLMWKGLSRVVRTIHDAIEVENVLYLRSLRK